MGVFAQAFLLLSGIFAGFVLGFAFMAKLGLVSVSRLTGTLTMAPVSYPAIVIGDEGPAARPLLLRFPAERRDFAHAEELAPAAAIGPDPTILGDAPVLHAAGEKARHHGSYRELAVRDEPERRRLEPKDAVRESAGV